jgi:hypothetical protein
MPKVDYQVELLHREPDGSCVARVIYEVSAANIDADSGKAGRTGGMGEISSVLSYVF